ncbi:MAG TPA: polysaccharide biosynthesis tyrosine autokinase [Bryobacteraceae bacterium]|nr:polysaccharide biosynthesis tyrosine autokinase [Bryobacteraceae bacterium]
MPARRRPEEDLRQLDEATQIPCLLLEYGEILRRRKGTLAVGALLGIAAALVLAWAQTPAYQARALLEVQVLNDNFLDMRDVNPTATGHGAFPGEYDLQTEVNIFQSEAVVGRAIKRFGLKDRLLREQGASRLSRWRRALGSRPPQGSSLDEVLSLVTSNLKVRTRANTRIVEVLYEAADPKLASDFVNVLSAEFIEQNLEGRWQTAQATGDWLTRQIVDLKVKLEGSEAQLQTYASASGLLFTSEKENLAEEKLRHIQQELSRAQADRVAKQSRYELVASAAADSLPEVLDSATLKDYQAKLTELRRELAELSISLTPNHPSVKRVQAQGQTLRSALESERANILKRIGNEFDSSTRRENLLAAEYSRQARVVSDQAAKVTHYTLLKREVDTLRQLYDSMLQRVKEAGLASALRASNIRVVDPARPPARPSKPKYGASAALGLLAGLFFGSGFVVLRARADRTIQVPGDAPLHLELPELGVIPSARLERKQFAAYFGSRAGKLRTENEDGTCSRLELATWQASPSLLAESFRATLESILYLGDNGNRPRVIAVTSAHSGEGKTTLATNLALALAEVGHRVLLIDGDVRRPRIHTVFGLPNEWGLSDVLAGSAPPEGLATSFTRTNYRELYVLSAGSEPASISDALHSPRVAEFIDRARRDFDEVIIDTPPMLQVPDARVLGRLADGVVLVVRSAATVRETARAVAQRLLQDRTRVLGTVLNDWNPKNTSRYARGYATAARCDRNGTTRY